MAPLVSIILPTYNRAHFLARAFSSITSQTFSNFEVIVVDDGSNDNTKKVVEELSETLEQQVRYMFQENQGPGVARQNGINNANGDILAFFDSDDEWLPDHLAEGLDVLSEYTECDWVYFSCRRVDKATQATLLESTFYDGARPNQLFSIARERKASVYQLDNNKAAILQLQDGIDSGLQNSLIRKRVFEHVSIPPFRVGEDRLLILMVLKQNFGMFFKDKVTVLYNVHDGNTSDTASGDERFERRIVAMERLLSCYEGTSDYVCLNPSEQANLNRRLADDYFWKLGYSLYWAAGNKKRARECYLKALKLIQYKNMKMLKSFVLSFLK